MAPPMEPPRRFCRFRTEGHAGGDLEPLPGDGMCLSAFVLLSPESDANKLLFGMVRPEAKGWLAAGGLDMNRAARSRGKWMLPSSHLLVFESPDDAAKRVLREQLGVPGTPLHPPIIVSETYARGPEAGPDPHWDLHFIYRLSAPAQPPGIPSLWERLEFVEPRSLDPTMFARGHGDILELAGLKVGPGSPSR
jgi:8-oxo-dGTP pyrophosphatase MutT (NUDIX family)